MTTARHFRCTRCGKCCHGALPLTCKDAFTHSARFPLCFVWTPVRQDSKDFTMAATLGTTIKLLGRKQLAVLIVPTAYVPKAFPCPALGADNLCSIQVNKPARCRAMPFYPYREERFQAELLHPRAGWACDTSTDAPIVFRNSKIIDRDDFDRERQDLLDQVPVLRHYADYMLKHSPTLVDCLVAACSGTRTRHAITSLSSFLTATRDPRANAIAQLQLPLLTDFATRTTGNPDLADFHRNYAGWSKEMAHLSQHFQSASDGGAATSPCRT